LSEEEAILDRSETSEKTMKRRRGPYRKAWATGRKST